MLLFTWNWWHLTHDVTWSCRCVWLALHGAIVNAIYWMRRVLCKDNKEYEFKCLQWMLTSHLCYLKKDDRMFDVFQHFLHKENDFKWSKYSAVLILNWSLNPWILFKTHVCLLLEWTVSLALFRTLNVIDPPLDFRCLINHHLQISIGFSNLSVELNEMIVLATCCRATHALECLRGVIIDATSMWTAGNRLLKMPNPFLALFAVACLWNWFPIFISCTALQPFDSLENEMFCDRRWW